MTRLLCLFLLLGGCAPIEMLDRLGIHLPGSTPATAPAAAEPAPSPDGIAYYTCPMHPSIRQPGPGSCPICGMTLTPVKNSELESGAVRVDATRRERFGIELEPAAVRQMGSTLRLAAIVAWDQDHVTDVSARVAGWVDRLGGAPGEHVAAGQLLYSLYSPDLVSAQGDLLRAAAEASGGESSPGASGRRDAARQRLVRWGLSSGQVDAILSSGKAVESVPFLAPRGGWVIERNALVGAAVSPGQTLYRLGDLSQVWLEAAVPGDQLSNTGVGKEVSVTVDGQDAPLQGKIAEVLPELNATTRTARVRIILSNRDLALRPDQWATVTVDVDGGDRLAVPESAVMYTGPRRLVFVDMGDDLLAPRAIETGMKSDGYVEVKSGLAAGESVVRAGNFLVAADSRLKQGGEATLPDQAEPHSHEPTEGK